MTQHGRHLPDGDSLKTKLLLATAIALSLSAVAQTNSQSTIAVEPMSPTPTFRVTDLSVEIETKKDGVRWQAVLTELNLLRSVAPVPTVAGNPAP